VRLVIIVLAPYSLTRPCRGYGEPVAQPESKTEQPPQLLRKPLSEKQLEELRQRFDSEDKLRVAFESACKKGNTEHGVTFDKMQKLSTTMLRKDFLAFLGKARLIPQLFDEKGAEELFHRINRQNSVAQSSTMPVQWSRLKMDCASPRSA
jgi:hypothetical protein